MLVCRVKFCIAFLFGILIFLKYSIFFYVYFFGDEFLWRRQILFERNLIGSYGWHVGLHLFSCNIIVFSLIKMFVLQYIWSFTHWENFVRHLSEMLFNYVKSIGWSTIDLYYLVSSRSFNNSIIITNENIIENRCSSIFLSFYVSFIANKLFNLI